ncbi:pyridine nucleotide-disulfide oxidoreductase [bacterium]|nr:MAG: pyridine nucleotide-disulfide oxidoreductase [bacterium]
MGGHLVLIGGGHAHLTTISNIRNFTDRGHRVTVVGPAPYHYYSGMAPGVLSGFYRPQEIRFHTRKTVQDRGGHFIEDKVVRVDPYKRELTLISGGALSYDIASFNIGSQVLNGSFSGNGRTVFQVKPIENLLHGKRAVESRLSSLSPGEVLRLVVIGGGPAGVELAGALWKLAEGSEISIVLVAGVELLNGHPHGVRTFAKESLESRGIQIMEGVRAQSLVDNSLLLDDGSNLSADLAFIASGVKPNPLFIDSPVPTGDDGGLLVNDHLQSVEFPEIFGGGDCITLSGEELARVGVYAVRQNPVLYNNLLAALEGSPLEPFNPGTPSFLLILNMSDNTAILRKGRWIWRGRMAFRLKDRIDRRFMKKYQVSGEIAEPLGDI